MDPEQLKGLGNDCLKNEQYDDAIKYYTDAIEIAKKQNKPTHVYYSNRCAANLNKQDFNQALVDADLCIEAKSDWPKAYIRRASSLSFLKRYAEAAASYKDGLAIDPSNAQLQNGLTECEKHLTGPGNSQPAGSPFGDPNEIMKKLSNDSRTSKYLTDPSYMRMLTDMSTNPNNMMKYMSDPRMMETLSVIMGIDMTKGAGDTDKNDMDTSSNDQASNMQSTSNKNENTMEDQMEEDPISEDEEDLKKKNDKKMAENEKQLGTAAYKLKDFSTAHKHYKKAFELDSTNMVYLMNTAAVHLEESDHENCRNICKQAIDIGRDNRSDHKLIAKALARIGTSYEKENTMDEAITYYNKSISEYREKSVLDKLKKIEKKKKEASRVAAFSEEKFVDSKAKGNACFGKGEYPDAIKHYADSVLRKDDQDKNNFEDLAIIYSNRAACYTKLIEFQLAIRDCKLANTLNPNYVKAYLRKGTAYEGMKKHTDAKLAFEAALKLEPSSQEAQQGYQRCIQKAYASRNDEESISDRVMNDPEICEIMKDHGMRLILEQMQSDPNAIRDHLKNPEVAAKITKLIDAGIIKIA